MEEVVVDAGNDWLDPSVPGAQEAMKAQRRSGGKAAQQSARKSGHAQKSSEIEAITLALCLRVAGESRACAEQFELAIGDGL